VVLRASNTVTTPSALASGQTSFFQVREALGPAFPATVGGAAYDVGLGVTTGQLNALLVAGSEAGVLTVVENTFDFLGYGLCIPTSPPPALPTGCLSGPVSFSTAFTNWGVPPHLQPANPLEVVKGPAWAPVVAIDPDPLPTRLSALNLHAVMSVKVVEQGTGRVWLSFTTDHVANFSAAMASWSGAWAPKLGFVSSSGPFVQVNDLPPPAKAAFNNLFTVPAVLPLTLAKHLEGIVQPHIVDVSKSPAVTMVAAPVGFWFSTSAMNRSQWLYTMGTTSVLP